MARTVGVEYPGAIHQVTNRGDRREAIFRDVRLQAEPVLPVKWITERLRMEVPGYMNLLLYCQ